MTIYVFENRAIVGGSGVGSMVPRMSGSNFMMDPLPVPPISRQPCAIHGIVCDMCSGEGDPAGSPASPRGQLRASFNGDLRVTLVAVERDHSLLAEPHFFKVFFLRNKQSHKSQPSKTGLFAETLAFDLAGQRGEVLRVELYAVGSLVSSLVAALDLPISTLRDMMGSAGIEVCCDFWLKLEPAAKDAMGALFELRVAFEFVRRDDVLRQLIHERLAEMAAAKPKVRKRAAALDKKLSAREASRTALLQRAGAAQARQEAAKAVTPVLTPATAPGAYVALGFSSYCCDPNDATSYSSVPDDSSVPEDEATSDLESPRKWDSSSAFESMEQHQKLLAASRVDLGSSSSPTEQQLKLVTARWMNLNEHWQVR